jgi:hypothetical protein
MDCSSIGVAATHEYCGRLSTYYAYMCVKLQDQSGNHTVLATRLDTTRKGSDM